MKIVLVGNYSESIINFRGALLQEFVKAGHEVIACAPGAPGNVPERLKQMGVTYRQIQLDRTGVNPFKDLMAIVGLIRLLNEIRPDILLCYTIKPIIYGTLAGWLVGVKRIYSVVTGLGYIFIGNSLKQQLLRPFVCFLYRQISKKNKIIFFLNQDDKLTFKYYGIIGNESNSVFMPGEGIDVNYYKQKYILLQGGSGVDICSYAANIVSSDSVIFLLIARLIWDKGIQEYVDAAKILSAKYENVKFWLLGPFDCNPTAICKKQVEEWQLSGAIEYLGETDDVRPFLAASSVYVLPSYREGLPRTVLEAMAMSRPIVTTDAPGCRATVTDGDNGYVVPVQNAEALASAMENFILYPELIMIMGKRSRELAEEIYDVNKVNAIIMKSMGLLDEKAI